MRNKLFFLIMIMTAFVLVLTACGFSDDEVETSSDEVVKDVMENDAREDTEDNAENVEDTDTREPVDNDDAAEGISVDEKIKEALIEAGVYGLDKGQEYSVHFKGEEFEFEHLGCERTGVSNYLVAEGPNNPNVYIKFNFDEDGTLMYHNGFVHVMNIGEENKYHADRDELEANNFIAIEEDAKIVYGEVPVYLDGEIDNEMEMLTFYLDCGDQ